MNDEQMRDYERRMRAAQRAVDQEEANVEVASRIRQSRGMLLAALIVAVIGGIIGGIYEIIAQSKLAI